MPFAILLVLAGCNATPSVSTAASTAGDSPTSGASGAPPASGPAASVITSARLDDAASLTALEGVRLTPAGTAAAAVLLGTGVSGDELWAATYVYASGGTDPAPLRPIVANAGASSTVRAMAAAGLVGMGDESGFEPLIALLGHSDPMDGAEPSEAVWEFAGDVLERYTRTGFGPTLTATEADRTASQAKWTTWLAANQAHLHFEPGTGLWATT